MPNGPKAVWAAGGPGSVFVALFEGRDGQQGLAFEELEEGTATGGDVAHVVGDVELAMAARVSPPPAMEKASEWAMAEAIILVPPANWGSSNTPTGPFQTMVPALAMISPRRAALFGPMSRMRSWAATSSTEILLAQARAETSSATTTSVGRALRRHVPS